MTELSDYKRVVEADMIRRHDAVVAEFRSALEAANAEIARLKKDCGDLLNAANFRRDADLADPLGRSVVLDDIAGMRPAMVAARRAQQATEGDAMLWQCFAAEGHFQPLLLTVWKQRKAAESRITDLERQLAEETERCARLKNDLGLMITYGNWQIAEGPGHHPTFPSALAQANATLKGICESAAAIRGGAKP